jgi:hypothetical protein
MRKPSAWGGGSYGFCRSTRGVKVSGEDTPLRDPWDEICVQVQYSNSFHWSEYDDIVRQCVASELARSPKTHLNAMWLQTDSGCNWSNDDEADGSEIP